jgi:hypothetical protein
MKIWVQLALYVIVYFLCVLLWSAEQALGIGRAFVYSVF